MQRYSWPGNVRELRNVVERLLLLADGAVDAAAVRLALPAGEAEPAGAAAAAHAGTLAERTDAFEREQILAELKRHHQRMTDTAKSAGAGAQPPVQEVSGAGDRSASHAERGSVKWQPVVS